MSRRTAVHRCAGQIRSSVWRYGAPAPAGVPAFPAGSPQWRCFPADEMASTWGRDRHRYTQEPFEEGVPAEFGYQGKATPQQIYRSALKDLKGFDLLAPAQQDQKLRQIESTLFFSLLRRNTIEGMFCDPMHGGNVDLIGWQLIGFPGPRMSNYADVDKHYGEAFRPKPVSLRQVTGDNNVRPSEDEA